MSLRRMQLRDFVIVQNLDLEFTQGFSVLTGETGAGKSILVDALQLALGSRGDAMVVREGAERTEICAEFATPPRVVEYLEQAGFAQEESTLLLRRVIDGQGKSRAWVNGSAATLTQLRELGELLVDIHGQHAWQSLTRPAAVRDLLDAYGGCDREAVTTAHASWRAASNALAQAKANASSIQSERERLQWQLDELAKLNPGSDEWESLNSEHARAANAQALLDAAQAALTALSDGDEAANASLHAAGRQLQSQAAIDPSMAEMAERVSAVQAQTQDLAHDLRQYIDRAAPDPARLGQLDERLSAWIGLARRMRCASADLPALGQGWATRLAQLDASVDLESLLKSEQQSEQTLRQMCKKLSNSRVAAAKRLSSAVTAQLQRLGMAGGVFEVALQPCEPSAHGAETVDFLVAGHAGTTPKPVGKIASGGELSRISLAIAVTTSELGIAPTLVFDEVDSGVGGAVAQTVGKLMKQLGAKRQVLCVTHLPQVASAADQHGLVQKISNRGQAPSSQIEWIQSQARVQEIARMLGGESLTPTTLAHAKELLTHRGEPSIV